MRSLVGFMACAACWAIGSTARADVLYSHAPASPAGLAPSSWVEPDDSDADQYSWDAFVLPEGGTVTQVTWRGGYAYGAQYGRVTGFVIGFWPSNSYGGEPDLSAEPAEYSVRGLAGEHYVGTFDGTPMYEYAMTIEPGFVAEPGVKYWIQIEASQSVYPDWGLAWGEGGDGSHFRFIRGYHMYFNFSHDTAFTLLGIAPPSCPADFNSDGAVDTRDVVAFLNAWTAHDPRGDFNGDGTIDTRDVLVFLNAWTTGC